MTMLEMMYVYFDKHGDIKTISPDPVIVSDDYSVTTMPLKEVEDFLAGRKNPFDFYVNIVKSIAGTSYKITRKQAIEVSLVRTLDNFLNEVKTMLRSADAFVLIENFVNEKKIKITLNPVVGMLLKEGNDEDRESVTSFINHLPTSLFFTRKGDPYFLLHTLVFSPKELFDKGELFWDYNVDLSRSSVYTKKLIDAYSYKVI